MALSKRGPQPKKIGNRCPHRHRLVINIGGQKFGSETLGGKHLGKIYFQTTLLKKFEKIPFYSQKFLSSTTFSKIYALYSKCTPFSLYLSFFVSVSAFFHVFTLKNNFKKISRLIIGGQKRGFAPILIIGGAPGLPPDSTPMSWKARRASSLSKGNIKKLFYSCRVKIYYSNVVLI